MKENSFKILVVDDEEDIVEIICYNLKQEGYITESAFNGEEALKKAKYFNPDLIVLDIMMPVMDGLDTLKHIRESPTFNKTAVLILTALSNEESEITGLDQGADDYVGKPVKPQLLLSRIKALLRRTNIGDSKDIQINDLIINREKYLVINKGDELFLPKKEFELLALLASSPGRVLSRAEIMNRVWGENVIVGDRTIDVHVRKIRQKLGNCITTVKGVGYKLES